MRSMCGCRKSGCHPQKHGPAHGLGGRGTREAPHSRRTPGRGGSSARARHSHVKPAGDALRNGPQGRSCMLAGSATPRRKHHAIRPVDHAAPGSSPCPGVCSARPGTRGDSTSLLGFRGVRPPRKHAEKKRLARSVDRTASVTANPSDATASRPGAAGASPQPVLSLGARPRIHTAKGSAGLRR